MSESKSKLEIVLMPLAVAVVGIVGSLINSIYQAENVSKLADARGADFVNAANEPLNIEDRNDVHVVTVCL